MSIDYEGLYARDYFGHLPGSVSFQQGFHELLASVVGDSGCAGVVDIGAGNGELVRRLTALGIAGVPLDFRGDDDAGVLPFDLTSHDPARISELLPAIVRRLPGSDYLSTCLDVLEHIGRDDVASALWNLRELTGGLLLVSVSTRPSSRDNLYHATVAPRRTWRRLFEAAGFELVDHPAVERMSYQLDYPDEPMYNCMTRWRRLDPFGDTRGPEPYYMLLRKRPTPGTFATFRSDAADLLGLDPAGRRHSLDPETHLTFVLGHYQDFHHYRPLWDVLDRRAITVLVRAGVSRGMDLGRYRMVLAYLRSHGLAYREVESVRQVDWHAAPGNRNALVVATESSAIDIHLLNSAYVLAARAAGYRTFQLQHGIWSHDDFPETVAFASEHVLSWSDEYRDGFLAQVPGARGIPRPRGIVDSNRFTVTGCPKFDEYADTRPVTAADLLGEWAEPYRKTVLVATNLHWPRNYRGPEVAPALIRLAERSPETLFLVKLHPVEDPDGPLLDTLPPNLRVLDEYACLLANISTPRLVRASDATIATPSSILLEAALAGRPFAMIDTGNPNGFLGVHPVPIAELGPEVDRLLDPATRAEAIAKHEAFRDHYYDRTLVGLAVERTLATIEADLDAPSPPIDSTLYTAFRFATVFTEHFHPDGRARIAALEREVEEAKAGAATRIREADATLTTLGADLDAARADLSKTQLRLDAAHERLAPVSDLGPTTLRVARALRKIAGNHPRAASAFKAVARRGLRLLGR